MTTLDVLSGGRGWLSLGAGYHGAEAAAMGLSLPPTAERFAHLEDTLRPAHRMRDGDATPFAGTHHRAGEPVNSPPRTGRLPIPPSRHRPRHGAGGAAWTLVLAVDGVRPRG